MKQRQLKEKGKLKRIGEQFITKFAGLSKKQKTIGISGVAVLVLILILVTCTVLKNLKPVNRIDPELVRAMTYEEFKDIDEKIDGTDNVKFSAFFLRDINGDGYAEKIKGTCKQIGSQDTMYMEINVETEGYLKDANIQIDGKNFYLQTALPKDEQIKESYIGNNIKEIKFNNLASGTQKLLTGMVRSGDYSYDYSKISAIGNNINNYSRDDNQIILTGTYVANDGTQTPIRKTIDLSIDWYGVTSTYFKNVEQERDISSLLDEKNETVNFEFTVTAVEEKKELSVKKSVVEGEIPLLNGYEPKMVEYLDTYGTFSYDSLARKFVVEREAKLDDEGTIKESIATENTYRLKVVYPIEAYYANNDDEEGIIKIPVEAYYEGFNNQNEEFENPYKSEVAKTAIISKYRIPEGDVAIFSVKVGNLMYKPAKRYVVSKDEALKMYNGIKEDGDTNYTVKWSGYTGSQGESSGITIKDSKYDDIQIADKFIRTDSGIENLEDIAVNIGISFSNQVSFLGENGWIKVYNDDTDELIETFTKKNWNTEYKYKTPVRHIRVETSETNKNSRIRIYNEKQLDNSIITSRYTREEFDELLYLQSSIAGYLGGTLINTDTSTAKYEAPYSIADIEINNSVFSTQETQKNNILTIKMKADQDNEIGEWKNGSFLIKLPEQIIDANINNIEISDNDIELVSYELLENDGNYFIKINTKNEITKEYEIKMDIDLTPDPRTSTNSGAIVLYASNENASDYYYGSEDIYDVNDNLNIKEKVNRTSCKISLVAPSSLLTSETASNFDKKDSLIVAPQIADVETLLKYGEEEKTADIGIQIKNNYSNTISETIILGKIPFEGNTYSISGQELNSEFSTKMKAGGISVPDELQDIAQVYYSENENPDKEIDKVENEWKTAEQVENWDNIKSYLIQLDNLTISKGQEYEFKYTIKIPEGIEYNKIAYSNHGVFFSLDTPEGKYQTQAETNKIGFRIAKRYNLELTKYQKSREKLVPGATYRVIDEETGESKTAVTNASGELMIKNLYIEKEYTLKEIKTSDDYSLNSDDIKFKVSLNDENNLYIEKIEGNTKEEVKVVKADDEDYKITVVVEDEVKGRLNIVKRELGTDTKIANAKFELKGVGLPTQGILITTDKTGEINYKGLEIDQEYSLRELSATGYYIAEPVKFKIVNEDGEYKLQVTDGMVKANDLVEDDSIPTAKLIIEDEKIPTYNIDITKIKKITQVSMQEGNTQLYENQEEITYLAGAKFKLYKDNKEIGTYITNAEGKMTINNLYQYVEGKDERATYTLKEVQAPEGYAKVKDIIFKVQKVEGQLKFITEDNIERNYTAEGNVIKLIIEDSPSFKLLKTDAETNQPIANVKFAIYKVDEDQLINEQEMEPAKNSKGEILGTKEEINGEEYYTVTTDSNGELTADLQQGLYKAVEVEAPDKYDISNSIYYFGIGETKKGKDTLIDEWSLGIQKGYMPTFAQGDNRYMSNYTAETTDGGYIVCETNTMKKYNASGEEQWSKEYTEGEIYTVAATPDGGIIAGGKNILAKYNSLGEKEWSKQIGTMYYDFVISVSLTEDGGYIVSGMFQSQIIDLGNEVVLSKEESSPKGMIIKYDSEGGAVWAKSLLGSSNLISSAKQMIDGGYIVVGYFSR